MNRFCIAAVAVALVLGGCSAPTDQSGSAAPEAVSTLPSAAATAVPSSAPTVVADLATPPTLPFGGDCSSVFTSKEVSGALGHSVKLVKDIKRSVVFDELFVNASNGVLVCTWLVNGSDFDAWANAYVFDEALVASPGDSVSCKKDEDMEAGDDGTATNSGDCFLDFEVGGLWASVTLSKSDDFDEAALRRGGATLKGLFGTRATSEQRAGTASRPEGTWDLPDGCATFAQVDYSRIADKPVKIVGWEYESGIGEADGHSIAQNSSGELSCDIQPRKKSDDGGAYGNFFVLPGMAGALGTAVPIDGDIVKVDGADTAHLFPYPDLYYVVTSGPNLIIANLYSPGGNDNIARTLLSDLIAAANAG
jgi:hypothetical protein